MSITMRQVFGEALVECAEQFPNMAVLDADVSSSTQTALFAARYPERFFNFGIAEGNMTAAAAGMAACGKIPVVSTFAFLLAARALDPVHSLISYNNLNVKIAGGYAGLSDFADGASHQSICDMAIMRSLPNLTILAPSDEEATRAAVRTMLAHQGPVYLRLSRDAVESLHEGKAQVEVGKAQQIEEGEQVAIIVTGALLGAALEARKLLLARGIRAAVIESICIKPMDEDRVIRAAKQYQKIATLEEHTVIGGLGDAVCAAVCKHYPVPVEKIGLLDIFGESARSYPQLLVAYGLDAPGIAGRVEAFVKGSG